jgi:hypothetical protein
LDHSEQKRNALNISSDSSLDEVLEEAERCVCPENPPIYPSMLIAGVFGSLCAVSVIEIERVLSVVI